MRRCLFLLPLLVALIGLCPARSADKDAPEGFEALFNGKDLTGWKVNKGGNMKVWGADKGILYVEGGGGGWLMTEKEYDDFELRLEFKLPEKGNSGVALRAPLKGDPAFDGMELQLADFRYNTQAKPSELTGGVYRAIAPTKQVYKPTEWNTCRIELKGTHLKVTLNGELIQDVDLTKFDQPVKRHDNTDAPPIKDRPRRGHIGFQHLSRDNVPVQIRAARIKELK